MAKTLQEKIDELLGRLEMGGAGGGVMSQLDTPANAVQDAHRERYLMDMFSGINPDTGESFLEPTKTEYQTKLEEVYRNPVSGNARMLETIADQLGMTVQEYLATASGARGLATPAMRDEFLKQKYLGDTSEYTFGVDGATESYGFSGGDGLTDEAITNMRISQGIIPMPTSSNLGLSGERGFETPVMRDTAQRVLSRLSETELRDVMEILPQLTPAQYMAFIAGLEDGSINPSGYEVTSQYRLGM